MTSARLDQMSLVTAIVNEIANQQPDFQPVPRQFNAIIDAAANIFREFARGEIVSSPGEGIHAWRRTDQVGLSSDFMAAKLGDAGIREYAHPQDPSDFGRCLTLLEAAPELRERLPEMANESPAWAALWQEESPSGRCPKMFQRMQALLWQTAV